MGQVAESGTTALGEATETSSFPVITAASFMPLLMYSRVVPGDVGCGVGVDKEMRSSLKCSGSVCFSGIVALFSVGSPYSLYSYSRSRCGAAGVSIVCSISVTPHLRLLWNRPSLPPYQGKCGSRDTSRDDVFLSNPSSTALSQHQSLQHLYLATRLSLRSAKTCVLQQWGLRDAMAVP
ncbi:hypothetical protein BJ546DRAFT_251710 [Cryomyces antarcticus]